MRDINALYREWCEKAVLDEDLQKELPGMTEEEKTDAFYQNLSFGTAGLRGVLGAGTNRMNVYTVGAATQGLAQYVLNHYPEGERVVAISRDSRIKSELFTKITASIFAANGVKTWVYKELMPTPCLSYAVRELRCSAGVMITASHNPAKYNGYKAYGADGAQMTEEGANEVLGYINQTDLFTGIKWGDYDKLLAEGMIEIIPDELTDRFIAEVKAQSCVPKDLELPKDVAIVYTPLNGAGYKPVMRVLTECGYSNVTVVPEQAEPDGNFPTCTYPNPELRETLKLGMDLAEEKHADLLLATDPDSDRCAIAVRAKDGTFKLITGNELGCLLLDYICAMRKKAGTLPERPVAVKSLVSTDLAGVIAEKYGVEMKNVLTGFKYIGDQILLLEEKGEKERYIFGFEESCGYLSGTYARDKDAVNAAFLVTEMFSYYKSLGIGLYEKMQDLYKEFGYYKAKVLSFEFEGIAGQARMKEIIAEFRKGLDTAGGYKVTKLLDYGEGLDGLPKSDVLKFFLESGANFVVRPSGTEPKVKLYITAKGADEADADRQIEALRADLEGMFK
ncbi:MAG: phospho-sugar mutase [Lachnospiraceae bacterium]|nr:phospho-sugar mutase [Lachnospiraceae bacterium]